MILEMTGAEIRFLKVEGPYATYEDGLKHVKVLPYLSIVQAIEGSYGIALGNEELVQTGEGGFFIAPAGVQQTIIHYVNASSKKMLCRWIFIDVEINREIPIDALYQFPMVIKDEKKREVHALFDRIFSSDNLLARYSGCYALLERLVEMASPIQKASHPGVQKAVSYITKHYASPITVGQLARMSNMSESNLYAAFQKHVGASPMAYLSRYRLSIAADRLIQTSKTVSEICYSVGISDPRYFSKAFKKTHGMTPKNYRLSFRPK